MLTIQERLSEAENYINQQKESLDDLVSLVLWSARRQHSKYYKEYIYNEIDRITNQTHERL
ncbi:hypothetical protein ACDX78_13665 [Virgibacillus oceani]